MFGNYCSLRSQSCLKHLAKWVIEVEWVSKVKVILWPWSKVTQISKLKLVLAETVGRFGTKIHMKAWGRIGMKIYTNELGHMTNMAAMPIYGKNLNKSSSREPIDRWPWSFVCSIVYASTTKVVQIITLGWPWHILRQGQIWWHRLLYGKKWKLFIFLETFAALGLKVAWSIQLNELMKLSEYQWSRSFFDLGQRSLRFQS